MSTATGRVNWPFAAAWAACTFVGWLAAVWLATSDQSATYLLLAGILAQIVTIGLRWRLIAESPRPRAAKENVFKRENWFDLAAAADRELTWLLCWGSLCHLLGMALLGPGIMFGLALGLAMLLSEIMLLRFAPIEWNAALPEWFPEALRPREASDSDSSAVGWLTGPTEAESEPDIEWESEFETVSEFESEKLSATFYGQTSEGSPYLQGWQRYELAASQRSISLTIGFFPPFVGAPDCELDHEGDEAVSYEIEHLTPAGARIVLKRRDAAASVNGKLLWHCCRAPSAT